MIPEFPAQDRLLTLCKAWLPFAPPILSGNEVDTEVGPIPARVAS